MKEAGQRKMNATWCHSYVESNDQTALTSRTETDSQVESRGQLGEWLVGRGIEQSGKRICVTEVI